MSQAEQKKIWQREKEQQLNDKQTQPREVRRRKVALTLGGAAKKNTIKTTKKIAAQGAQRDQLLRKQLGI